MAENVRLWEISEGDGLRAVSRSVDLDPNGPSGFSHIVALTAQRGKCVETGLQVYCE